MKKIVFATNNLHKLEELRKLTEGKIEILSLKDINCNDDIPETADTLEGNALIKARWVKERYGYDCFADDTGLEVDALDGAPGVYSARYAGDNHDSEANMRLLLANLEGKSDRRARFRTVIALIEGCEEHIMDGVVEGSLLHRQVKTASDMILSSGLKVLKKPLLKWVLIRKTRSAIGAGRLQSLQTIFLYDSN